MKTSEQYVIKLVKWENNVTQMNMVCKNCFASFHVNNIYDLYKCIEMHTCPEVVIGVDQLQGINIETLAKMMGIPILKL